MKVLAIDTSNQVMGVAVSDGDTVLGEFVTNLKKNHSVRLMPAIDILLQEVHMQPSDLDRIAVAAGPGSYTGVRIGVSVAKTMAWSLNIPLVGISSLEALAMNGCRFSGYLVPLFDGRRGQVYTGLYQGHHGSLTLLEQERIMLLTDWLDICKRYTNDIMFLGQDLMMHQTMIKDTLGDQAVFAAGAELNPQPGHIAVLGSRRHPVSSPHTFVPEYLQLAEAEAKWQDAQRKVQHETER